MEMGKAISQKIREAIRAKLIDLGNYVDEELPDYIMVMIANKKTEEQMEDDLALFLGTNTDKFCGWLQGVLKKLQAARDEQKERKEKGKDKKKKSKKKDDKKDKRHRTSSETKADDQGEGSKSSAGTDTVKQPNETTSSTEVAQISDLNPVEKTSQKPAQSAPKASTETAASSGSVPTTSSSQPVISLFQDTDDFFDEEIKMNEAAKKPAATDSVKSTQVKGKGKIQSVLSQSHTSPKEKAKEVKKVSPKAMTKESREHSTQFTVAMGGGSSRIPARDRPESVPVRGSVKSRLGAPAVKRRAEVEEKPRILTTMSTVVRVPIVTMKRSGPGSVIGQVIEGNDEDSDDDEPVVKRMASTVKPRRRQPLPKTKQNSMALLKKAITQAQESTSVFPAAGQFSEPRRMIVRSASQPGTMKIVARSIPADKEPSSKRQAAPKTMFTAAVRATNQAEVTPRPSTKASVSVRPLGLMSRSRFKEANERNFDAHTYQRVEKKAEEEEEEVEAKELEEEVEEEREDEQEQEDVAENVENVEEDDDVEEREIELERATADSPGESVEDEDDQRQIIKIMEADEAEPVVVVEPDEGDVKVVELIEEDEREMEIQEQVYDTRNTTIVRPLQYDRLTTVQKRERPSQPQPQYQFSPPAPEDSNPRFIVTMEGKKRKPPLRQDTRGVRNQAPAMPTGSQYNPTPISRLDPNQRFLLSRYEPSEEMEMDSLEEKSFEYEPTQPMQYQQVVFKERSSLFEKELPMKRVGPTEHQLVKDSLYSPPQPQVAPVTFTLQESDEEHGHAEMEEKVNERCKFWPACKNGSECNFFHPSTPCRTFPNCKFGDKCLFIHPNCKFDATCMNPTCPYTHATRTKPAPIIIQAPPIRAFPTFKQTANKMVCKFYPHCGNTKCPFIHPAPKMCRYNISCTRPDCKFQHTQVAARSAMKWTKDQHVSERKFASKSSTSSNVPS
ncbi:zinc finger CCCH domain-containing protein 14 isoform X2 [Strongylocentrotus purpuratus]|uniref:Zinc finger CCCH domain-containing protein 14 n=1 Tax=Strongylocentrotus purpuratus TaxID=7668 RepID=A0A7M7PP25_STRPU|nr:zinc finger CCCH domain-containing protein 14 isoform X2 [Strongylocentrotus purpuratus]